MLKQFYRSFCPFALNYQSFFYFSPDFTPTFALYFSFIFPNCAIILIPASIGKALNVSCYIVRVSGGYSARSNYILTSILHDIIISKHVLISPFASLLFVVTHFVSF